MKIGKIICAGGLLLANSNEAKADNAQFVSIDTSIESQEKAKIQENNENTHPFTGLEVLPAPKVQQPCSGVKKSEKIITRKKMLQQRKEQFRVQLLHRSIEGSKQKKAHHPQLKVVQVNQKRICGIQIHSRSHFDRSYVRHIQGESRT